MHYTITAETENKPGVLYRIADLFLRRKINIERLTVSEVDTARHISRFEIDIHADPDRAALIVRQMERIEEVVGVEIEEGSK